MNDLRAAENSYEFITKLNHAYFKNLIILVFNFIFLVGAQAQNYIVGDTLGRYVYNPEVALADASVGVDIDCDRIFDLEFVSNIGRKYKYDYPKLYFKIPTNVEVLNSGIGAVTRFNKGDTIRLLDDIWTPNLTFIYGEGGGGSHGVRQIDSQYIVFRKISIADTFYFFLNISSFEASMTIHKIISECNSNPLFEITYAFNYENLNVYPNPFSYELTFRLSNYEPTTVLIYDILGRKVMEKTFINSIKINTQQLTDTIYFYELRNSKMKLKTGKVIKQ